MQDVDVVAPACRRQARLFTLSVGEGLAGVLSSRPNNAHNQWMYGPLASPDGKHLAFQVQNWDSNVWLLQNF
jgi:hypothetical protein